MSLLRFRIGAIAMHAALVVGALLMLLPFLWALRLSFLPAEDVYAPDFALLPTRWIGFENYIRALTASPLPRFLLNGTIVCSAIILCQLCVMVPCAYALAKFDFTGRRLLWLAVLLGVIVPAPALAVPLFVLIAEAGLIDTYAALILPWTVSCLGIFLMRQFFLKVPNEVIEAARLDGLGELELLVRILVPMAAPTLGAFVAISLVVHWNDLMWPSVAVTSGEMATPPFGVMMFQIQEIGSDYGPLMAGALLIAAPLLVVFLLAQRRFLDGITGPHTKSQKGSS
jgi:multiple sugar transport system permease protein